MKEFLSDVLFARTPTAYKRYGTALGTTILLCVVLLVVTGPAQIVEFPWDVGALLDGGWRVRGGELPHVNFFSPVGSLYFALLGGLMWVYGPSAKVLALMPAVAAPILGLCAWCLARRRFPAPMAAITAAVPAFLTTGTFWLGAGLRSQTYAMQYNRLGWALLLLVGLWASIEPDPDHSAASRRLDDAIAGAAAGAMLFHKINFAVVAAVLTMIGLYFRRDRLKAVSGLTVGLVITAIPLAVFMRFRLDAVISDLRTIAAVATGASHLKAVVALARNGVVPELSLLIALAIAVYAFLAVGDWKGGTRVIFTTGSLIVGGLAVCHGNQQYGDIPTFALAGVVIAELLRRRVGVSASTIIVGIIAAGVALPFSARDFASVAYTTMRHFHDDGTSGRIDAPPFRGLSFPLQGGEDRNDAIARILADSTREFLTPYEYSVWVNDGLALLRPFVSPGSRILTKDMVNPFSFALGLSSPPRSTFFWNWGRLMDDTHHPPIDTILAGTEIVMLPKRPMAVPRQARFLSELLDTPIQRDFHFKAESRLWRLMVRNAPLATPPVH